jgi:hypothetical protein
MTTAVVAGPKRRRAAALQKSEFIVLISEHNGYTAPHKMSGQTISRQMDELSQERVGPSEIEADLLDPYERLISIEIVGKRADVPEKNRLLRCFQYLSLKTISYGDFCWNGECTNCQVWYHMQGQAEDLDRPALACRLEVLEGMVITKLSHFIELEGISK